MFGSRDCYIFASFLVKNVRDLTRAEELNTYEARIGYHVRRRERRMEAAV